MRSGSFGDLGETIKNKIKIRLKSLELFSEDR